MTNCRSVLQVDAEDDDNGLISMATPDEICALPAMDMEVTDVRYEGTLIPQVGRCAEHCCSIVSVLESVASIRWHEI
jgi:hypothetical protein